MLALVATRGTAVVVHDRFPHSVEYSTARPTMLLRDRGMDVHVVELGAPASWQAEGVTRWRRRSRAAVVALVARLRPELLFLEGSTWHLLMVPLAPHTWVRATGRSHRPLLALLQSRLIARASVVSVSNPHHAHEWKLPAARLLEFPYPLDVGFWAASVPRDPAFWTRRGFEPPAHDARVVSYAAQLMKRKRQPQVVSALAPLLSADPRVRLVFAGGAVEPRADAEVLETAAAAGVEDQVHVLGALSQEDLRQLFAWTTVHVVNSAWETQCLVVYESLASGVANAVSAIEVLTSAFPDLPAHRDEQELHDNVARLLSDQQVRDDVVAAARERVWWADLARHDALFAKTIDELLA